MDGRLELIAQDLATAVADLQARSARLQTHARRLRILVELSDGTRGGLQSAEHVAEQLDTERHGLDLADLDAVLEDLRTWIVQEREELERLGTRGRHMAVVPRA